MLRGETYSSVRKSMVKSPIDIQAEWIRAPDSHFIMPSQILFQCNSAISRAVVHLRLDSEDTKTFLWSELADAEDGWKWRLLLRRHGAIEHDQFLYPVLYKRQMGATFDKLVSMLNDLFG